MSVLQPLFDFFAAHKAELISIGVTIAVNELIALNPKFFAGSIGQAILNFLRGLAGKAPVSVPAPDLQKKLQ